MRGAGGGAGNSDGGLRTRGNGGGMLGAGTGAVLAADCCGRVPGFAGSDGCAGAEGWVPVGGACASC